VFVALPLLQVLPRATSEELQQLIQGLLLLDVQVSRFGTSPAQAVNRSGAQTLSSLGATPWLLSARVMCLTFC
jgi:hypothetical protein